MLAGSIKIRDVKVMGACSSKSKHGEKYQDEVQARASVVSTDSIGTSDSVRS